MKKSTQRDYFCLHIMCFKKCSGNATLMLWLVMAQVCDLHEQRILFIACKNTNILVAAGSYIRCQLRHIGNFMKWFHFIPLSLLICKILYFMTFR